MKLKAMLTFKEGNEVIFVVKMVVLVVAALTEIEAKTIINPNSNRLLCFILPAFLLLS